MKGTARKPEGSLNTSRFELSAEISGRPINLKGVDMKKILVLGAGLVARPLVRYLLEEPEFHVTVATRTLSKAETLIDRRPRGTAKSLNVEDTTALKAFISSADLVISLLPWTHHIDVAKHCIESRKHLVTTSYVKPEMQALDADAKNSGLLFLNEIGVDPGIDHMAAMRVIDGAKKEGGEIFSFYSYCGGLPALESNNNPFGYKFSWSPVGVMLAANNNGRYLKDGRVVQVTSEKLFEHYWLVDVPGVGTFEAYVNRDAFPYIDIYGIQTVHSMYRGTLRNIGHCESWNLFKKLGLFDQDRQFPLQGMSPRRVTAELIGSDGEHLVEDMASFLGIPEYSVTIKKMAWLGLLSDHKVTLSDASPFDLLAHLMQKKLIFEDGEVDLLVQHHEFIAEFGQDRKEKITATMVETGVPGEDSAMARTVGLPAAIAAGLILKGKITLSGVRIPVVPEIYEPVLTILETMGIGFEERRTPV
jgi:saccharopine dehydrogenase-like NADP-dependent oxidoreductase